MGGGVGVGVWGGGGERIKGKRGAMYIKSVPLLVRVVWTVSVSSSPCSSTTCDRAGTPAGPVRADKIVYCSYICHASRYFILFFF